MNARGRNARRRERRSAPVSTAELLARVRHIEIRTRKLVTEALAGAYLSTFKGQGMEFSEVREYARATTSGRWTGT